MRILGCAVRWRGLTRLTLAVALGVAVWAVLALSVLRGADLGTLSWSLVGCVQGCVFRELGLDIGQGWRPALAGVLGCVLLLAVVEGSVALLFGTR